MIKIAIVLAAGYKAIGWGFPDVPLVCPEALLPIGEQYGGTPVARLCTQLEKLGWKSFVAVGRPGCRYTGMLNKAIKNPASCFPVEAMPEADKSPWTYDRLQYVAYYGIPLLMPDPDLKSYDNSAMQCIDMIGTDWWNTLAIIQCDFVWPDAGLRDVLAHEAPCQVLVHNRHVITEILTPETTRLYCKLGESFRHRERWGWTLEMKRWPDGLPPEGKEFREHVPYCFLSESDVCANDLDAPKDYVHLTKEWLPKYG